MYATRYIRYKAQPRALTRKIKPYTPLRPFSVFTWTPFVSAGGCVEGGRASASSGKASRSASSNINLYDYARPVKISTPGRDGDM